MLTHPMSASAAHRAKLGLFGVNARPVQPRLGCSIVHVRAEPCESGVVWTEDVDGNHIAFAEASDQK
jgi:hypothetical protein